MITIMTKIFMTRHTHMKILIVGQVYKVLAAERDEFWGFLSTCVCLFMADKTLVINLPVINLFAIHISHLPIACRF